MATVDLVATGARSGKLFDALAIRDTAVYTSDILISADHYQFTFPYNNGLNTSVALQFQGSPDVGTTWVNIGTSITVTGGTIDYQTLNIDAWERIRVTAVAAGASGATTGALTLWYEAQRRD
ncbi:MAG TPA: hypothetical protein VGR13_03405 [Actinomycetota bacterium]|jgi:hypothetical protein|nr:hypothetical protein [Actinomycetota bacterium]